MSMYATEINNLESVIANPYFGRFEFKNKENGEVSLIYIGKKAIADENGESIAYDWRSPICSIYYDFNIGPAEYSFKNHKFKGEILSKRQIIIKDKVLQSVSEEDVLSNNDILIKYLEENLDARLKSIIATIQREQNQIIRRPIYLNNIIEGVAGSGKTTVALHRIAYLLYNNAKNISEHEFMILGPNKYFLNFISDLLPDLDIKNVKQMTFEDLVSTLLGKVKYSSRNITLEKVLNNLEDTEVIKYKSSLEYLQALEKFIYDYIKDNLQKDIEYNGVVLCKKEKLKIIYDDCVNTNKSYIEKINLFIKNLTKEIKTNGEDISHSLWLNYRTEFLSLPKDSIRRQEILELHNEMSSEIKKGCPNTIKNYFKFIKINPLVLYKEFIKNLDKYTDKDITSIQKYILAKLDKNNISYDDLAPLLLLNYYINGADQFKNYAYLVIDEAQDLSQAQFYVLKKLFPKANFDVFGDINQSIYSYEGITNWQELNKNIFNNNASELLLNTSYRITTQISDVSNEVLKTLDSPLADCVARRGCDVSFKETSNNGLTTLLCEIKSLLDKDYKTIAIICKNELEAKNLYKKLSSKGISVNLINEKNEEYRGGLCIIPTYLAKGLEFDAVILNNANDINYPDNEIDMKLLYVSITRAMHELVINYEKELALPLKNYLNNNIRLTRKN